ncbi:MAG: Uma2 family endonuclease [Pirellulaceae bacterium]
MTTHLDLMTAEQLAEVSQDGKCCELVQGELRMMSPAGNEHGRITVRLTWRIAQHVEREKLGVVFAAETGFLLHSDPDTVRAPDLAFVTKARQEQTGQVEGYWPGAPDLAVEVVSPNDSFSGMEEKALAWLAAGACVVWIVDPRQKHVTVYRDRDDIVVLEADAALAEPVLLPGWQVRVGEIFES